MEISWEEALDIAVKKLKEVYDHDPGELFLQGTTTCASEMHCGLFTFGSAFGTNAVWVAGGGIHCGSGAHQTGGLMHASWSLVPDFKMCNYAIYFGASKGHSAGHVANQNAQLAADARARGMKMVVVDPMCNFASGKGNEWVPIRVGTDAALALGMANVLVNELGMYDRHYLKQCTNAAYLVKEDGHYLRDAATNKPLVWDETAGAAKTFDAVPADGAALLGTFTVNGVSVRPGFEILEGASEEVHAGVFLRDNHDRRSDDPKIGAGVRRGGPHRQHDRHRRRGISLPAGSGDLFPRVAGP